MRWNTSRDKVVIYTMAGVLSLFAVVLTIGYFTGVWVPSYHAEIVELGICLHNSEYIPVQSFPNNTNQVYLCGKLQGTTYRTGILALFYENSVIYQDDVRLELGTFFTPISLGKQNFKIGHYQAEIGYAHQILAQTQFTVVDAQSP